MNGETTNSTPSSAERLEEKMQKVALAISLAGLGLMGMGFLCWLLHRSSFALPGDAVISLRNILQWPVLNSCRMAMSVGIILLGLIPMTRVILAGLLYVRAHDRMSALVALIVLLELIASIRLSV